MSNTQIPINLTATVEKGMIRVRIHSDQVILAPLDHELLEACSGLVWQATNGSDKDIRTKIERIAELLKERRFPQMKGGSDAS